MNSRQIYNLFSFVCIMQTQSTIVSPDYVEEKALVFLGKMGKDEFIRYSDSWFNYCDIWGIDKNNYRLMNVFNYLYSINFRNQRSYFDNFEIYFGSFDSVSSEDLRYKVHFKILEQLDKVCDSRYLKLKALDGSI